MIENVQLDVMWGSIRDHNISESPKRQNLVFRGYEVQKETRWTEYEISYLFNDKWLHCLKIFDSYIFCSCCSILPRKISLCCPLLNHYERPNSSLARSIKSFWKFISKWQGEFFFAKEQTITFENMYQIQLSNLNCVPEEAENLFLKRKKGNRGRSIWPQANWMAV